MFKRHMSLLQIKLEEIPPTQFGGKFCPLSIEITVDCILDFKSRCIALSISYSIHICVLVLVFVRLAYDIFFLTTLDIWLTCT
jgi:hypothetical protein